MDVVVRTRKVGHFFPGGTVDAFDCWLELYAMDEKVTRFSGADARKMMAAGLSSRAHIFIIRCRSMRTAIPINKRNAWATRATVYVHLIPPGAADTVHFRLKIPPDAGSRYHLHAKLNYRKFAWWNTQFAFGGVRDPKDAKHPRSPDFDDGHWIFTGDPSKVPAEIKAIPTLPIVVLAENKVELHVLPANAAATWPN